MASGTFYPALSADDGYRSSGYNNSANYAMIGEFSGSHNGWLRFLSVTIPQGAMITAAYVKITSYSNQSSTVCNLNCYFNNVDNASAPVDGAAFDALVLTGAVAWNNVATWTDGTQYDTPSLVSILQTVIDRAGWSSGNALQVVIKDNSSDSLALREISTIEQLSGAEKAELHVTWVTYTGEISEDVSVTSEFADNFGELNEDVNVNSAFACLVADVSVSENVSVNSELIYFETNSPISEDVSVNADFISEHTGDLSEEASVNSGMDVTQLAELSEDVSINSEFVCYQRPANLDAELPMITVDILGGQGGFLDATLPLIIADIKSGAILEASLPAITASLEGKVGTKGDIDAILPKLTASVEGKVETLGDIDAELPAVRAYIVGITGDLATCEAILSMMTADIQGGNDLTGDIDATLPMIEPYMVGTVERATCEILRYVEPI